MLYIRRRDSQGAYDIPAGFGCNRYFNRDVKGGFAVSDTNRCGCLNITPIAPGRQQHNRTRELYGANQDIRTGAIMPDDVFVVEFGPAHDNFGSLIQTYMTPEF
jgi:hypothetical protein